jgi:membrane protein DedA with SNARE-associated domain
VLRLPVLQFSLWTFLGSLPRCLLLGYLGYLTRDTYEGLAKNINRAESLVSAGIVLGAVAIVLLLRARMSRKP